jgi:hypothetical protein
VPVFLPISRFIQVTVRISPCLVWEYWYLCPYLLIRVLVIASSRLPHIDTSPSERDPFMRTCAHTALTTTILWNLCGYLEAQKTR